MFRQAGHVLIGTDDSGTREGILPYSVAVDFSRLGASRRIASDIAFTFIDAARRGAILDKVQNHFV